MDEKPMKCWCGNEPEFRRRKHITELGCFNHPCNNKYSNHTTTRVFSSLERSDDYFIKLWNEKVRKHQEIERRKNQNCQNCGKHYYVDWIFCPWCGEQLLKEGE